MAKRRTTPWPRAMQSALVDAQREGYLRAIEDVFAAIMAGDLHQMLIQLRSAEGIDGVEPLCITLEHRIGVS
jgi:hypothetical protein